MSLWKKIKKAAGDGLKSVGQSATNNSVLGQITSTGVGAVTGGAVNSNKTGWLQGGNAAQAMTGGMASSGELSLDKGKSLAMGLFTKDEKATTPDGLAPLEDKGTAPVDPYLEEELKNARRRGRASTVLAGNGLDSGSGSAKRTLLGSI